MRVPGLDSDPSVLRPLQPSAVSVDFEFATVGRNTAQQQLRTFVKRCRAVASAVVGCSMPSRALMLMAWAEGFTHLTGDLIAEKTGGDLTPVRFQPEDLYREGQLGPKPPPIGAAALAASSG